MNFFGSIFGFVLSVGVLCAFTTGIVHLAAKLIGIPGAGWRPAWNGAVIYCVFRVLLGMLLGAFGILPSGFPGFLFELALSLALGTMAFRFAYGTRTSWALALALMVFAAQFGLVLAFAATAWG